VCQVKVCRIHEHTYTRIMTWKESTTQHYAECLMVVTEIFESNRILDDPISPTNTLVLDSGHRSHV